MKCSGGEIIYHLVYTIQKLYIFEMEKKFRKREIEVDVNTLCSKSKSSLYYKLLIIAVVYVFLEFVIM